MENRTNFCGLPFTAFVTYNTGRVRICCDSEPMGRLDRKSYEEIWNGETWREVRRAVLADEQHPACAGCWRKESAGMASSRDKWVGQDRLAQVAPDGRLDLPPTSLYVRLGTECNLKCIMCSPHNSTLWNAERDINAKYFDDPPPMPTDERLLQSDWLRAALENAEELYFAGGEPLLIKGHTQVLEHVVKQGQASRLSLTYYSNLTRLPSRCLELWSEFREVRLNCSIDGVEGVYNYVRFPGDWMRVSQNVLKMDELQLKPVKLSLVYLMMNVNAFSLLELFQWRERQNWRAEPPEIRVDFITHPDLLSPELLCDEDKSRVLETFETILGRYARTPLEAQLVRDAGVRMGRARPDRDAKLKSLRAYLSDLDSRRRTNWHETFAALHL